MQLSNPYKETWICHEVFEVRKRREVEILDNFRMRKRCDEIGEAVWAFVPFRTKIKTADVPYESNGPGPSEQTRSAAPHVYLELKHSSRDICVVWRIGVDCWPAAERCRSTLFGRSFDFGTSSLLLHIN